MAPKNAQISSNFQFRIYASYTHFQFQRKIPFANFSSKLNNKFHDINSRFGSRLCDDSPLTFSIRASNNTKIKDLSGVSSPFSFIGEYSWLLLLLFGLAPQFTYGLNLLCIAAYKIKWNVGEEQYGILKSLKYNFPITFVQCLLLGASAFHILKESRIVLSSFP